MNLFSNKFFIIVDGVEVLILIISVISTIYFFATGSAQILYRISMGMAKSKISIFGNYDISNSLLAHLIGSGLFKSKNIEKIGYKGDLGRAQNSNIFLVDWPSSKTYIEDILSETKDNIALIIYAPPEGGRIENDVLEKINCKRNAVIVNFRGRLLNDIVTALITTRLIRK